ncbi:MAG TPA: ATP-binding protein [bacterium]
MSAYLTRTLERFVVGPAARFPVLLLTGARQVGKTSMLRKLAAPGRTYVTLDDPLALRLAREDPALFLERYRAPVLIDEIQYAPQVLPHVKIAVDRTKKGAGFWLTGSQPFHLMKGVSESLTGRVAVVNLLGLSRRELLGRGKDADPFVPPSARRPAAPPAKAASLAEMYRAIWRGSFPVVATDETVDRTLFFSSYFQTYLQRDVRDLARVGDEMAFMRFVRAAAARTGQLLNLSELARDADVAPNTAKSWLSILLASGVIHLLEPWHGNVTKRLVKAPKLYFLDTGFASYLTEWSSPETLEAGAMSGAMFETWVVAEILKSYRHNGLQAPLFHYRDRDGREIDLLVVRDGVIHPVEIKKSAAPRPEDARHFRAIAGAGARVGAGAVVCLTAEPLPLTRDVTAVPAHLL